MGSDQNQTSNPLALMRAWWLLKKLLQLIAVVVFLYVLYLAFIYQMFVESRGHFRIQFLKRYPEKTSKFQNITLKEIDREIVQRSVLGQGRRQKSPRCYHKELATCYPHWTEPLCSDNYRYCYIGTSTLVLEALDGKKSGTFFEAGAYDGFWWSPTLFLECFHDWTGILVEPMHFSALEASQRQAISFDGCVTSTYGLSTHYFVNFWHGGTGTYDAIAKPMWYRIFGGRSEKVMYPKTCASLPDLLRAHNITKLDFLSLVTEGLEPEIMAAAFANPDFPKPIVIRLESEEFAAGLSYGHELFSRVKLVQTKKLLIPLGYKLVCEMCTNAYFVLKDHWSDAKQKRIHYCVKKSF